MFSYYNFNLYVKSAYDKTASEFYRDKGEKYDKTASYCIQNNDYNDALFYQKIDVQKDTVYRVSCMVKTQDVVNKENTMGGAQIAIADSMERSDAISGTSDWTKLEFMFNSKDREEIKIAFRLGGNNESVKGKAWFSDFKVEVGNKDISDEWNVVCYIFNSVDAFAGNKQIKSNITQEDKIYVQENMERFANSCKILSNGRMNVNYVIKEVVEPITTISYDEEHGYYVDPEDVYKLINKDVRDNNYDHIFTAIQLAGLNHNVETEEWIGLGSMDYLGIGFANISILSGSDASLYKYSSYNTFPEEVYIHEFLHTLERNSKEYGYSIIPLHSYSEYGYRMQDKEGLKRWYQDYMQKNIKSGGENLGLDEKVYYTKPVYEEDFTYAYLKKDLLEPKNIIEEFKYMIERLIQIIKGEM